MWMRATVAKLLAALPHMWANTGGIGIHFDPRRLDEHLSSGVSGSVPRKLPLSPASLSQDCILKLGMTEDWMDERSEYSGSEASRGQVHCKTLE